MQSVVNFTVAVTECAVPLWAVMLPIYAVRWCAGQVAVTQRAVEKHVKSIFQKLRLAPVDTDHRRVLAVLRYLDAR